MDIVVLAKQIPDPNVKGEMDGKRLKREGITQVLDPGDEFGVEAALKLAEAHGGEVTVVSMGPERAMEAVRKALAMGAHKGVLISDDALAGADALTTAKVLAKAIGRNPFDIVLSGIESTDGSAGIVPLMVAGFLDVPQNTVAKELEVKDGTCVVHRQTDLGYDIVECPLPAVLTVTAGINEPRYPSFKGIVGAKQKPVEQLSLSDLGLSADDVQWHQEVSEITDAPARGAGEIVEDDGTAAEKIVEFLQKAKVI